MCYEHSCWCKFSFWELFLYFIFFFCQKNVSSTYIYSRDAVCNLSASVFYIFLCFYIFPDRLQVLFPYRYTINPDSNCRFFWVNVEKLRLYFCSYSGFAFMKPQPCPCFYFNYKKERFFFLMLKWTRSFFFFGKRRKAQIDAFCLCCPASSLKCYCIIIFSESSLDFFVACVMQCGCGSTVLLHLI